jgi:BirA family transcriptional regulator, biotin operon repressor / biotin---[acetyl-CoA-carboxylase] ligase
MITPRPPGGFWTAVDVVASTGSTNADLLARAEEGAAEGLVLVAEEQTAGRGRLGRSWVSVPGASLTFSMLLRPAAVPQELRGWLPLLTGVAVVSAVRAVAGLPALLKWPNDVLVGDRKLAGILAEQSATGSAVVIGVGVNVGTPADALPVSPAGLPATSLLVEGAAGITREAVLSAVLREVERLYLAFAAAADAHRSGLLAEYRGLCGTLGRIVRVELPGGRVLAGTASDIDATGRLLVSEAGSPVQPVSAGDVIHVRLVQRTPANPPARC